MKIRGEKNKSLLIPAVAGIFLLVIAAAVITIARTWGRTVIQIDIHQNKKIIHLSNFAEPPQFAIWLENPSTRELKSVFVTHRAGKGDWEGKANVPVALPLWTSLFKDRKRQQDNHMPDMAVTGATPKTDYFSIRVEVPPGSEWICWIEMNLAGDYNDAYPEIDLKTLREDEYGNGQPALIFRADVRCQEGLEFTPVLVSQSTLENGNVKVGPVSDGVTTARKVFDEILISVIRPKPKLIEKHKVKDI